MSVHSTNRVCTTCCGVVVVGKVTDGTYVWQIEFRGRFNDDDLNPIDNGMLVIDFHTAIITHAEIDSEVEHVITSPNA